ncbi:conserved hypothetical protein [Pediculus humanus corporis]|uniref:Uncharacterized protein n=1 Tax=Pediculus humanus subsp. corporis TaxID=121224 RepID=E0VS04_PEDHC|nr:uncharacterized protein Phum_PHUM408450 [Pediculus humanus corporis]EEB16160.1 conserved hypothetical protein [Pediculus humanus corporis]
MGQRCEFKDLDGSYLPSRQRVLLETASIAGGATIAVFLVVIACVTLYLHYQRKSKEKRIASSDRKDGGAERGLERRAFNRCLSISMERLPEDRPHEIDGVVYF